MDTILIFGAIFLVLKFLAKTATGPARSAASLERIEKSLHSGHKS